MHKRCDPWSSLLMKAAFDTTPLIFIDVIFMDVLSSLHSGLLSCLLVQFPCAGLGVITYLCSRLVYSSNVASMSPTDGSSMSIFFFLRWCFVGAFLGVSRALQRTSWVGCFHPVYHYHLTASVPTACLIHRGPGSVKCHVLVTVMSLLHLYPLCHFRWLCCVPLHSHSGSDQPFPCRSSCLLWWQHCHRHRRISGEPYGQSVFLALSALLLVLRWVGSVGADWLAVTTPLGLCSWLTFSRSWLRICRPSLLRLLHVSAISISVLRSLGRVWPGDIPVCRSRRRWMVCIHLVSPSIHGSWEVHQAIGSIVQDSVSMERLMQHMVIW